MKTVVIVLVLILAVGGLIYLFLSHTGNSSTLFRMAEVQRGDLLVTIGATGTVEPEEVVDVGSQVAGKIEAFGKDPKNPGKQVDYGTEVDQGTDLAYIDESMYAADVEQASALVEQNKANVTRAAADLEQMKAKLRQAENNWKRAKELGPSRALSATEYDSYLAAYETAQATVGVGQATVVQAQKAVVQTEAALKRSRTNLGYCTIRSPVKGVIIDRRVNIGQTVVASLNAPSLFLIAKDLKKMQVWASVNEADIGSLQAGQAVSFTVDAFPGRNFQGTVGKIRFNASMTQNVVTYTVEIHTDNSDGTLLPYLTANVRFEIARKTNVLLVPNAALRWKPSAEQTAPDASSGPAETKSDKHVPGREGTTRPAEGSFKQGRVWIKKDGRAAPVNVRAGLTDGSFTEIQGDAVKEGMEVIVGEIDQTVKDDTTNPFTPKLPTRRGHR